ncbi:hypothetical protein IMG5_018610 [Ichthyophthirius multifiliis]|uniref:Peptidase M20 dimerisation domain-containing protein n=1 Tax=Ichthyophthirius multifiliis TaxID=5932 RepID=G0QKJ0_ICHMU|nr:hypothetical protein IMG5_018610 [Ichthyophthirius multifiliis]EGR34265.1 hypothetical protein IMG5_018610 [Ichthyophthirius multifiliis]|eukprot:XP_004039569.1 hypothetical protein IMG5_018610 [Ichthyophthirius multifiliis]
MNIQKTIEFVEKKWHQEIQPTIEEYIRIPNMSKSFDPEWNTNGLQEKAANLLFEWAKKQDLKNATYELIKDADKSPLIYIEVPGTTDNTETVLMYGHFDKQPPFTGWLEGLEFNKPVVIDDKLYGRGGADDGYSIFGAVTSIKACQEQGLPHSRCVIMIEGDEESGSTHFPLYLEKLRHRLGEISVVFCLDSGALNYEQFWTTSSLRGAVMLTLNVKVLEEGVHSGDASGVVPSSFRILRILLDRIEDSKTGEMHEDLQVNIPVYNYSQAVKVSETMPDSIINKFPFVQGMQPTTKNALNAYINKTWKSQLSITGADYLPQAQSAGNVLRPQTSIKLSIRLPPTKDPEQAKETLVKLLTENPPYGAQVTCTNVVGMGGWKCPKIEGYLEDSIQSASQAFYGKEALSLAEGGSIPLMGLLLGLFPKSQFIITGVLGPNSNAHGPNEFLHIPFTKKLICCMSKILSDIYPKLKKQ